MKTSTLAIALLSAVASCAFAATLGNNQRMTGALSSSNLCVAPAAASSFKSTDARAYAWFTISNTNKGDVFRVEWYSPDSRLYDAATYAPLTASGSWCFFPSLTIAGTAAASKPGSWIVRTYWNSAALFNLPFTISATTPPPVPVTVNWISPPASSLKAGQSVDVAWSVTGPASVRSQIRLGSDPSPRQVWETASPYFSGSGTMRQTIIVPSPSSATNYYFVVHVDNGGGDSFSSVATASVAPPTPTFSGTMLFDSSRTQDTGYLYPEQLNASRRVTSYVDSSGGSHTYHVFVVTDSSNWLGNNGSSLFYVGSCFGSLPAIK